jgi:hypothetical protein
VKSWLGIDPGLGGAVAVLTEDGRVEVFDTPVAEFCRNRRTKREYLIRSMGRILEPHAGVHLFREGQILLTDTLLGVRPLVICALEYVAARPGQGVTSVGSLLRGRGLWEGILGVLQIPHRLVTAQSWKRRYGLLRTEKDASRVAAERRFPGVDLSKKKHDGRADALWLALYAKEVLDGVQETPAEVR